MLCRCSLEMLCEVFFIDYFLLIIIPQAPRFHVALGCADYVAGPCLRGPAGAGGGHEGDCDLFYLRGFLNWHFQKRWSLIRIEGLQVLQNSSRGVTVSAVSMYNRREMTVPTKCHSVSPDGL